MAQSAGGMRLRRRGSPNRCYEAIASARNVRHVTSAIAAIKQRPAKIRDVNAKVRILHQQVRPHLIHQVSPRNGLPSALNQCNQDIERATAKCTTGLSSPVQDASNGRESKQPKDKKFLCPHNRIIRHERSPARVVPCSYDQDLGRELHLVRLCCALSSGTKWS